MKLKFFIGTLSLMSLMLLFFSCKSGKNVTSENDAQRTGKKVKIGEDFKLTFERTPCYGKCPTFKLEVDAKGNVKYEGIRFVDNIGMYEKEISRKTVKKLLRVLENNDFWNLEDEYNDPGISDLPSIIVSCTNLGNQKQVKCRYKIPKHVEEMNESIESLIGLDGFNDIKDE